MGKKQENEQKMNGNENKNKDKGKNECYFEHLNDALSELQGIFVKLGSYKDTLYSNDKIGLFLVFLFESLYPNFEMNFSKNFKYSSFELTKKYRQHIYQTLYDQFWSKCLDLKNKELFNNDLKNKKLKLKMSSYRLRKNDNLLSWNVLMNLPSLNENCGTQFGALYDMLAAIDDDMDMSPLKPWINQMDLSFNETYSILLYLWFILDIELPSPPYTFIANKNMKKMKKQSNITTKPKQNKSQQNNNNHHQNKNNNNNQNKKKQNQHK